MTVKTFSIPLVAPKLVLRVAGDTTSLEHRISVVAKRKMALTCVGQTTMKHVCQNYTTKDKKFMSLVMPCYLH